MMLFSSNGEKNKKSNKELKKKKSSNVLEQGKFPHFLYNTLQSFH